MSISSVIFRLVAGAWLVTCGLAACSSASGPSLDPDKGNCAVVCGKAHDCIDDTVDKSACTSSCDDRSSDDVFAAKVKDCADCAEPKACTEVSGCAGDCLRLYLP